MEITRIEPFLEYLDKVHARTRRVVRAIPPERIEWRPKERAFSLGDVVRHLAAMERYMFAENVHGRPSRYPGHGPDLADGYDAVLAYYDRMHAEAVELFAALTPEGLAAPCETPGGARMAAAKWLRLMVEHEIHHRGQIYLMLNLLGVPTPPIYGLTSEQVRERSLPLEDGTPSVA